MRKFLSLFALLAALFAVQSTLAAMAAYGECCAEGCAHLNACTSAACAVCAAVPAAPAAVAAVWGGVLASRPPMVDDRVMPVLGARPWGPPD